MSIRLNVGGVEYATSKSTLVKVPALASLITSNSDKDACHPIDRDGPLFRHILNYARNERLHLPKHFDEHDQLKCEAEHFGLASSMVPLIEQHRTGRRQLPVNHNDSSGTVNVDIPRSGFITVGYRGSFAFGRDGLADVKFRKLTKILVSGRVNLCREVFGDTLNESRDPDHNEDVTRYTARFFLKHLCLEQAFDCLLDAGFEAVGSCGSGTSSIPGNEPVKPGIDSEETRWNHYNEFVFCRK